jgi:hypothetical protein
MTPIMTILLNVGLNLEVVFNVGFLTSFLDILDFAVLDHFQHPSILLLFLDSNIGPTY